MRFCAEAGKLRQELLKESAAVTRSVAEHQAMMARVGKLARKYIDHLKQCTFCTTVRGT